MGLFAKSRAHQQEGKVAVVGDSARLQAGELQADGFETVMARNVPNLQLLNEENTQIYQKLIIMITVRNSL